MQRPFIFLYEDNHLLVINKPATILSQSDQTGDLSVVDLLKKWLKVTYDKQGNVYLGLPHRLDRPVSGVLICCKTSKALERINAQFRDRSVLKHYWALCEASLPEHEGTFENFLRKNRSTNISKSSRAADKKAKFSKTNYQLLGRIGKRYLYELQPETGRPHQLRQHMKAMNAPIVGDKKYGARQHLEDYSIALHCRCMQIMHPTKKEPISFTARLPYQPWWSPFEELETKT